MGVDVDETRRDHRPVRINLTSSAAVHTTDLRYPASRDGHISGTACSAGPVNHGAAADHNVVLGHGDILSYAHD